MSVKDQIVEFLVKYGFQIVGGLIIFICGLFVAGAVGRLVRKSVAHFKLEPPVELLLVRLSKLVVIVLTGILTVSKMGVDIAPLVAGVGVVGVGIGLATQGVLSNVVAGLVIIFAKPFRVGEFIEIHQETGVVSAIDLLATKLMHYDKSVVVIPNRKIVGEVLHNYGVIRQLDLTVGVANNSDLGAVERTLRQVLEQNPKVLKDPAFVLGVTALADSSINFSVKPWVSVQDFPSAGREIYAAIIEGFRANQVEIPFPQRTLHVFSNDRASTVEAFPSRAATGI
jgi:small conductance mechanosensitive channel